MKGTIGATLNFPEYLENYQKIINYTIFAHVKVSAC